jgi:hypothetical protein
MLKSQQPQGEVVVGISFSIENLCPI